MSTDLVLQYFNFMIVMHAHNLSSQSYCYGNSDPISMAMIWLVPDSNPVSAWPSRKEAAKKWSFYGADA